VTRSMLKRLSGRFCKKANVHVLVLGLDNGGKSSLIQHFKPRTHQDNMAFEATPTVGFKAEQFQASYDRLKSPVYAVGEQAFHNLL